MRAAEMFVHDSTFEGSQPGFNSPATLAPEFRRVRRICLPLTARSWTAQYREMPTRGGIKQPELDSRLARFTRLDSLSVSMIPLMSAASVISTSLNSARGEHVMSALMSSEKVYSFSKSVNAVV